MNCDLYQCALLLWRCVASDLANGKLVASFCVFLSAQHGGSQRKLAKSRASARLKARID